MSSAIVSLVESVFPPSLNQHSSLSLSWRLCLWHSRYKEIAWSIQRQTTADPTTEIVLVQWRHSSCLASEHADGVLHKHSSAKIPRSQQFAIHEPSMRSTVCANRWGTFLSGKNRQQPVSSSLRMQMVDHRWQTTRLSHTLSSNAVLARGCRTISLSDRIEIVDQVLRGWFGHSFCTVVHGQIREEVSCHRWSIRWARTCPSSCLQRSRHRSARSVHLYHRGSPIQSSNSCSIEWYKHDLLLRLYR